MELQRAFYQSPIGIIEITGSEDGIATLYFIDENIDIPEKNPEILKEAIYQLDEYFNGIRREFDLKLNPEGTEFRKRVWSELVRIPFGKTTSYLGISEALGDVKATRAVGNANGSNPISIIVPCHRVIGASGKLVGYGGGLWRKEWLLNHEKGVIFGKQTELF
ncbi:MAG: methylated-DNA--[protein]-cysteine S-methyltransferase [Bacteroidia bacterium]